MTRRGNDAGFILSGGGRTGGSEVVILSAGGWLGGSEVVILRAGGWLGGSEDVILSAGRGLGGDARSNPGRLWQGLTGAVFAVLRWVHRDGGMRTGDRPTRASGRAKA